MELEAMDRNPQTATQIALRNVTAKEIRVGSIVQTVNDVQRPQPLSTSVNSSLPPLLTVADGWQVRPEESKLRADLASSRLRLVGICAAGGFGKSALAAQVYGQVEGFEQKLWANFQEPVGFGIFGRWLMQELLGFERYDQRREHLERDSDAELLPKVLAELSKRRCLLVLDNLETLFQQEELWQPYGDFFAGWLWQSGGGKVVLTSRFRLELPTAAWGWHRLQGLSVSQGVELLKQQGIEGAQAELEQFVTLADGHPLLLTLAANVIRRRVEEDQEEATIVQLGQDDVSLLQELHDLHRGDPEASVGRVLDASFEQLYPEWLRQLLWRLSFLRQGFGLEAAQAMVDETVELADLRRLARWSFLQEQRVGEERGWQFSFLPLIQCYLRSGAAEAEEERSAHRRAIEYFEQNSEARPQTLEQAEPFFEQFHHHCELEDYAAAYQAINSCYTPLERQGHYRSLLPIYEQLTQQWSVGSEPSAETQKKLGWAWTSLGILYNSLSQYEWAIQAHKQAQQWFNQADFVRGLSATFVNLGNAHQFLGNYHEAIDCQSQSLEIQREIGDRNGEAASSGNLGIAYKSLGNYDEAIDYQSRSLEIKREIGDRNGEAASLGNLGYVYQSLGKYQEAIDYQSQSLEIKREIGDRNGEASSLSNLGIVYQSLGNYQEAIDYQSQSLSIRCEIGDRNGEAASLSNLGTVYQSLGNYDEAIDYQSQSLAIQREIGDRNGEAASLSNLGIVYQSLGNYQEAINYQSQSLEIMREIGDRNGEAKALGNLGIVYQSLGNYQEARNYQSQSLAIQREIGDRNGEARSLGNLGTTYQSLGKYQEAIDYQSQSLEIAREIGDRNGEASFLVGLGNAHRAFGNYHEAIGYYSQSLAIQREIGDRNGEASSLVGLGNTYQSLGKYQEAIDYQSQSLEIQREIGDRNGEAISLFNMGNAWAKLQEKLKAQQLYEQARDIFQELKLDHMVEKCDTAIADCLKVTSENPNASASATKHPPSLTGTKNPYPKPSNPNTSTPPKQPTHLSPRLTDLINNPGSFTVASRSPSPSSSSPCNKQRSPLLTVGMDQAKFKSDRKTQLAVLYNITVLGEAVKRLTPEFREQHPAIAQQASYGIALGQIG